MDGGEGELEMEEIIVALVTIADTPKVGIYVGYTCCMQKNYYVN